MNRVLRRLVIGTPALLLALSASTGTATAHEDHEAGGGPPEPFVVTCEGVEYNISVADGKWAAAIDRQVGAVFLPKAFTFTVSMGDDVLWTESLVQGNGNAHKNQASITCVFADSFTDDKGVTFEFAGTATVVRAR